MIKQIVMFELKDTDERSACENAFEAKRRFDDVIAGVPLGVSGTNNLMKVEKIGRIDGE